MQKLFKKLNFLFLVAFVFFAVTSYAQRGSQGWTWQNPLPQGNPLYSIHFAPDKETGFAVGSDATILKTTDGGFSWKRQFSPVEAPLSAVFVRDKNSAFIVGARNTLLTTTNGGKDWKQVEVDARDHFYGVKFTGAGLTTGWIVGSYGRILKTADGGATWKTQISGTQQQLLNIDAFDETRAIVVGVGGVVLITDNGGDSWKQSDPCARCGCFRCGVSVANDNSRRWFWRLCCSQRRCWKNLVASQYFQPGGYAVGDVFGHR